MPKQIPITGLLPGSNYVVTVSGQRTDGTWTAYSQGFSFSTLADTAAPDAPTGLVTDFTTNDLIISWTPDASTAATDFKDFEVSLTANGKTLVYYTASSSYTLTYLNNLAGFTAVQTSIAVSIKARDTSNNLSTALTGTATKAAITVAPAITATGSLGGYDVTIDYTNLPPGATYVELFEYTGSTGSTGKTSVWKGPVTINKASIVKPLTAVTYYVDAYYVDSFGQYGTVASSRISVLTQAPSAVDQTPPPVPTLTAGTSTITTIPIIIATTDTVDTKNYWVQYKKATDSAYQAPILVAPSGSTNTSYTITGLTPNTSYDITVFADDGSNSSATSSVLTVSTLTQTVSPPTGVSFNAKAYSATAVWTAPSSPSTPISAYKVELWQDLATDVLLQTLETTVPNITIPGLGAGLSYYVKVFTKDIYGVYSTALTSSTITLNSAGNVTDGVAPASSPTPTVNPLFGALEVKWTAISNADPVTYEVHISATSGFTPSISTKSLETSGTFAVIKTLPAGTALAYGTTYYVKIIAKDFDGSAAAGTQASGAPSQVDNGDIAANAVRANVIQAGTITATQVDATNLFVGKTFAVGTSAGTYDITIDASGNGTSTPYKLYSGVGTYQNANTAFYLDSDGKFSLKDKLYFDGSSTLTVDGVIKANSGTFNGNITVGTNTNQIKIDGTSSQTTTAIYSTGAGYGSGTGFWLDASGRFSLGSALTWTGSALSVTGSLNINGASTFTGNVNIGTGGSLYSGTLDGSGNLTTTGYILNSSGLLFGTTAAPKTAINASTGAFSTTSATIGGWSVNDTQISKSSSIFLDSSTPQIYVSKTISGTTYTAGIKPGSSAVTDKVFWAGDPTSPSFYVTADGKLNATGANISGTVGISDGSSVGGFTISSTKLYAGTSPNIVGMIPASLPFFAGATDANGTGAKFTVSNSGNVTANNIQLAGDTTVDPDLGTTPRNVRVTGNLYLEGSLIIDDAANESSVAMVRLFNSADYSAGAKWYQNPSIAMNMTRGLIVRGNSGYVVAEFPVKKVNGAVPKAKLGNFTVNEFNPADTTTGTIVANAGGRLIVGDTPGSGANNIMMENVSTAQALYTTLNGTETAFGAGNTVGTTPGFRMAVYKDINNNYRTRLKLRGDSGYLFFDGNDLDISGKVSARSGWIGAITSGWKITESSISNGPLGLKSAYSYELYGNSAADPNSNVITLTTPTVGLLPGMLVTSYYFNQEAYITAVSGDVITTSVNPLAPMVSSNPPVSGDVPFYVSKYALILTPTKTSTTTFTVPSGTAGAVVTIGMLVTGTGITPNTYVTSVSGTAPNPYTITVNNNLPTTLPSTVKISEYAMYAGRTEQYRRLAPFKLDYFGNLIATSVSISGDITATSGSFTGAINASSGTFSGYVSAGTSRFGVGVQTNKDGIYMNAANYWYSTGEGKVGGLNISSSNTGISYDKAGFNAPIDAAGASRATVTVTANPTSTGTGTAVPLSNTNVQKIFQYMMVTGTNVPSGTFVSVAPGSADTQVTLSNSISYSTANALTFSDIAIYAGDVSGSRHLSEFIVDYSGNVFAKNAYIQGEVKATSGTIGGFTIGSTSLYAGSGSSFVGIIPGSTPFFAGATDASGTAAKFTVSNAGAVTATSGTIGGMTLGSTSLTAGSGSSFVGLTSGTTAFFAGATDNAGGSAKFTVTSAGAVSAGNGAFTVSTTGAIAVGSSFSVTAGGAITASNLSITGGGINLGSGVFTVSNSGALTATNATIAGAITASSGSFTGSVTIASGGSLVAGNTTSGVTINNSGLFGYDNGLTVFSIPTAAGSTPTIANFNIIDTAIYSNGTNTNLIVGTIGASADNITIRGEENTGTGTVPAIYTVKAGTATTAIAGDGFYIGRDGKFRLSGANGSVTMDGSGNLSVTGEIKAKSGYIGGTTSGWAIGSNSLTNTNIGMYAPTPTTRTNLITNPSFEVNTTGYSSVHTAARDSTYAYSGSYSYKITYNAANTTVMQLDLASNPITSIGSYTYSAYIYVPAASTVIGESASLVAASGSGYTQGSNTTTLVAGWNRVYRVVNYTSTASLPNITMVVTNWSTTEVIYVDAFMCEKGDQLQSYIDTTENYYGRINLVTNPSFESGVSTGWAKVNASSTEAINADLTYVYLNTKSYSLAWINTTATDISTTTGTGLSGMPVEAGQTYSASAYVKSKATARNATIQIVWYAGATVIATPQPISTAVSTSTTAWTRISVSGAAPATATHATIIIKFASAVNTSSETHYVDAVLFEKSSSVNTYFDGSFSGASWMSTPNLSPSKLIETAFYAGSSERITAPFMAKYDGSIYANNFVLQTANNVGNGSVGGVVYDISGIRGYNLSSSTPTFNLDATTGKITATNAEFYGAINATSGVIGQAPSVWNITSTGIDANVSVANNLIYSYDYSFEGTTYSAYWYPTATMTDGYPVATKMTAAAAPNASVDPDGSYGLGVGRNRAAGQSVSSSNYKVTLLKTTAGTPSRIPISDLGLVVGDKVTFSAYVKQMDSATATTATLTVAAYGTSDSAFGAGTALSSATGSNTSLTTTSTKITSSEFTIPANTVYLELSVSCNAFNIHVGGDVTPIQYYGNKYAFGIDFAVLAKNVGATTPDTVTTPIKFEINSSPTSTNLIRVLSGATNNFTLKPSGEITTASSFTASGTGGNVYTKINTSSGVESTKSIPSGSSYVDITVPHGLGTSSIIPVANVACTTTNVMAAVSSIDSTNIVFRCVTNTAGNVGAATPITLYWMATKVTF